MTYDLEHNRRPIAFLLQSNETSESYAALFTAVRDYFSHFEVETELRYFTSDGAHAIRNGLGEAYDLEDIVYKNDLWQSRKM